MRWKTKYKNKDLRIRKKFLFFPKTINGETRWLEKTSWIEEYCVVTAFHSCWFILKWEDK